MIRRWRAALVIYRDPRILRILFLGFSSGLPYLITASTLSVWLRDLGVSLTTVGLFALVAVPYSLKFAWAPLVDRMPLPFLTSRLGRRRSWMLLAQAGLIASVLALGALDPTKEVMATALLAMLVALCAATQDIGVDAYRVEVLQPEEQGAGAAVAVLGYRIGMLASGAGALAVAQLAGWQAAFGMMAALVSVGMVTVVVSPEPTLTKSQETMEREARGQRFLARHRLPGWLARLTTWCYEAVVCPFAEFMSRPAWLGVLLFIMLFRFGDSLASVMANPFYLAMDFTKMEIAAISKVFGVIATLLGGFAGGVLVSGLGMKRALLVAGLCQMLSNLMFAALALVGHSVPMLTLTIAIENVSGGMAAAAFVAYVSALCNVAYTATQYALLTSFASFARTVLSSSGGWLAVQLGWPGFFVASTFVAAPGLLLLLWLMRRESPLHNVRPAADDAPVLDDD